MDGVYIGRARGGNGLDWVLDRSELNTVDDPKKVI